MIAMQTVDRHTWIAAADLVLSEWRLKKAAETHGMHREHQLEPLRTIRLDQRVAVGCPSVGLAGIIRVAQNILWLPTGTQVVALDLTTLHTWSLPLPSAPASISKLESLGKQAAAAVNDNIRCATLVQYRLGKHSLSELWLVLGACNVWIWPIDSHLLEQQQQADSEPTEVEPKDKAAGGQKEEGQKAEQAKEKEADEDDADKDEKDQPQLKETGKGAEFGFAERSGIRPLDGVPVDVKIQCLLQATESEVWGGTDNGSLLRWNVIAKQLVSAAAEPAAEPVVALAALSPPAATLASSTESEQRIVWSASHHPSLRRFHLVPN